MLRGFSTGRRAAAVLTAAAALSVLPSVAEASGSGSPVSASEGQPFSGTLATFDHPVRTATIAWGDGASDQFFSANGSTTVRGSHTYGEEGAYGITVTDTSCGQGACDQASTPGTVVDASLSSSGTSFSAGAGSAFSGRVADFSDADPQGATSDYAATIDWGDGSASTGAIGASSGGGFEVDGSHTYSTGGSYVVRVAISDHGGAGTTATATASVSSVTTTFTASSSSPRLGDLVAFDASASRASGTTVASYQWLVNGQRAAACDGRTGMLTTRFSSPGSKTITLVATDAAGHQTSASQTILVGRAAEISSGRSSSASIARVRHAKLRLIKVPSVYECQSGKADTFTGAIEAAGPRALGAGCVNQVEAGIVQVDGCLTEHRDTIDVLLENVPGTPFFDETPRQNQPLDGIPNSEAFTFESDIALQFSNNPHVLCSKLPKKYQEILCPTLPGAGDEGPPSVGGSGPPPPPARDLPARAGAASGTHAAALKGVSSPEVAVQTPCNYEITPPKSGAAGFVHPCFRLFVSADPVVINGLTYKPAPGAVILVSPEFNLVISHAASTWLGKIKIHGDQEINFQLPGKLVDSLSDFPALDVLNVASILAQPEAQKPAEDGGLGSVGGFKTDGSLHVGLGDHTSRVSFQVDLPPPITDGSGGPVTATANAVVSSDGSFQLDSGYLHDANAFLGPVALKHFSACWRLHPSAGNPCPGITGIPDQPSFGDSFWDATGELDVGSVKLLFRPPAPGGSEVSCPFMLGIGFGGGRLAFAGAALTTGPTGVQVAPGVSLTNLGASFSAGQHLTTFCAYARFSVAEGLAHLVGQIFAVFADSGYRYTFTGSELGPGMPPGTPYTNHFALGAGGELYVNLPALGDFPVGGGYVLYVDDPNSIFFGANFKFSIPTGHDWGDDFTGVIIGGGLNGAIGLGHGYPFWIEGTAHVVGKIGGCVLGVCDSVNVITGDVDGIISRGNEPGKPGGVAVCGGVSFFGLGITGGFGYHWGDDIGEVIKHDIHTGGCDFLSAFRVHVAVARDVRAHAAESTVSVRVPRGVSAVDLYLDGGGGAPDLTLTGPGVSASTAGLAEDRGVRHGDVLMARASRLKITYLTLLHPRPGIYHLHTNPGSVSISAVHQADGVTPSVHATVTGRGLRRALRYTITRHPGQLVSFLERSGQTRRILGSVIGGRGTISFSAPAGIGRRAIVAEVLENGHPVQVLAATSYQPSRPLRLPKVSLLRVRRQGTHAVVSFARVPHASAYAVRVRMRDGLRLVFLSRRPSATASGLFVEFGGLVEVRALGDGVNFLSGPARRAGIPPAVAIHAPKTHRQRRRR